MEARRGRSQKETRTFSVGQGETGARTFLFSSRSPKAKQTSSTGRKTGRRNNSKLHALLVCVDILVHRLRWSATTCCGSAAGLRHDQERRHRCAARGPCGCLPNRKVFVRCEAA